MAKPLRLALGACIIQAEYGYSDEEITLQIQENPYLQYFCGYAGYDDERLPFDPSLMVYFRKRLTPEVLGEINEMILRDAKARQQEADTQQKDDNDNDANPPTGGGNSGTLIVDATCAPSEIRFPQDVSLLDEARENAEQIIDALQEQSTEKKPRTYRNKAHKDSLKYIRSRKHTEKKTREAIRKQLQYLRRDLSIIDAMLRSGLKLSPKQQLRLETLRKIYEQQKSMYDNHTHSVPDRIVSISQPFIRPIVRGKAGKPVEFGAKLDISVSDGWTRLEYWSFDAYNEATKLIETINCVIVKDLSRLGRNYVETGEFLEKVCPFLGLRFIAVNDNYDSVSPSSNAQLSASLANIVNDFYARDISRKVSTALHTKMEKGEYIGSWEKYGYLKDPENKNHLIVNPDTASVVRMIFEWRSTGMSYMGINRKLNEMGIPSPGQYKADRGIVTNNNQKERKILWNKHMITCILSDTVYLGQLAQHKSGQCPYAGVPFAHLDEQHWIVAENTHEAIIEQELFDKVQEINRATLETTKANHGKYDNLPKAQNIYGEKLICADCGARMKLHRSFSTKKDKVYFTFNCPTYSEHGKNGCVSKVKRKAELDEAVFQAIRAQMDVFMDKAYILKNLLERKQAMSKTTSRRRHKASLESKIKSVRSAIATLYVDFKDDLLTDTKYLMQKEKYQAEIAEAEAELSAIVQDENDTEETLIGEKKWASIVGEYADAEKLSEGMLKACVNLIKVHSDGSLEISFNYMEEFEELLATTNRLRKEVA